MSDLVSEWVTKVEEDWSSAQILLRDESPLVTSALFHLQQCAEKLLSDVGDLMIADAIISKVTRPLE